MRRAPKRSPIQPPSGPVVISTSQRSAQQHRRRHHRRHRGDRVLHQEGQRQQEHAVAGEAQHEAPDLEPMRDGQAEGFAVAGSRGRRGSSSAAASEITVRPPKIRKTERGPTCRNDPGAAHQRGRLGHADGGPAGADPLAGVGAVAHGIGQRGEIERGEGDAPQHAGDDLHGFALDQAIERGRDHRSNGGHHHQGMRSDPFADRCHAGIGEQPDPAVERQQHAHHGEADAELLVVERQHGVDQRVADQGDGDDQSRQRHADRHGARRGGGAHALAFIGRAAPGPRARPRHSAVPRRAPCSSIGELRNPCSMPPNSTRSASVPSCCRRKA